MKKLILLALFPLLGWSQTTLQDNFSDGNFSQTPAWQGDTNLFAVNPAFQLQLQDSAAGTAYLTTPSGIVNDATWEFWVKLDFNPSGSNFVKFYLVSNRADLSAALNGYFVRVSGSSDDRISLFRQDGSSTTPLIETADDWADTNPVNTRIRVKRSQSGQWKLAVDTGGATNFTAIDSTIDTTYNRSKYLGLFCEYTKTRASKIFLDEVNANGNVFVDSVSPQIDSLEVLSNTQLEVTFSESVEKTTAEDTANYSINHGRGTPITARQDSANPAKVSLRFSNAFQNQETYVLTANGVEDAFGNVANANQNFTYFSALPGDVVINELLPDPDPVIGLPPNALPEHEYIELYNTTSVDVNLADWRLVAGSSETTLPSYILPPDSFVVITEKDGASEFSSTIPVLGIDISSVALTNSGQAVRLFSPKGKLISNVSYRDDWFRNADKRKGGWALEQIDPANRCAGRSNWKGSTNPIGGTPGKINSIRASNPDTTKPGFTRITVQGDSSFSVIFTEPVNPNLLQDSTNFRLTPGVLIDSIAVPLSRDRAQIFLPEPLQTATRYKITLQQFPADCQGNRMQPDTLRFGLPSLPEKGDILINELLFNPPSGGADFVELYNNSEKVVDLRKLRLGNWDGQAVIETEEIVKESFLLKPGSYVALTTDLGSLRENYEVKFPENIVEAADLPGMSDDKGSIAVATAGLRAIAHFSYSENMHLTTLEDPEGVSLERVSFTQSASDNGNWQSAAEAAGYATPGYENSHFFRPRFNTKLKPVPKVFSPNGDGYHDQVKITYQFDKANNIADLSVYTDGGILIKKLIRSQNLKKKGFFIWDGTDKNGQRMRSGIYVLVLEYFNESGASRIIRETCVLSL